MSRPIGVSAGGLGLALSWLGGAAIARLTGATPIVIVLAVGLVLFAAGTVSGWTVVRRVQVGSVSLPPWSTQGDPVSITASVSARRPVWVVVHPSGAPSGDAPVAGGWAVCGRFRGVGTFPRRGVVGQLDVRVRSAGGIGLVWWERRITVPIGEHVVAARRREGDVPVETGREPTDGRFAGAPGAVAGQIDGVRPWREGDSEKYVHWASSLRSGELVVHDRRREVDHRRVVRARPGTSDPDVEAGIARGALEASLRDGALTFAAVGNGEPTAIPDSDAAARWSGVAPLGPGVVRARWWRVRSWRAEPESTAGISARWWAAAATMVSLAMLIGALGMGAATLAMTTAGVALGVLVSARSLTTGEPPSPIVRALVGVGALAALALVLAATGRLDGLLAALRGPLPQVLIVLVVLHGFEGRDRRTIRVGLGISGVVLMYAAGFRVDDAIIWWLLAWAVCFAMTLAQLAGPTARSTMQRTRWAPSPSAWPARVAGLGAGAVATVGVLAVVPVPTGPADLTLPTLVEDARPIGSPGAIAGPDGEIRDAGDVGPDAPDRAPAGQAGGYTGFASTMDTSVRGDLSDEVVMRVRAPEPDFWRGQTFARFDGRRWYADADPGVLRDGPVVDVPSTFSDIALADDVVVERFVQTYHLETDMPNLVFHANRPTQVIVDADVWTRNDGAIRAATVLPEGSIYTVVSARARVDASLLRRQRLIGPRLNDRGRQVLARYLDVPPSTSPETVALANELAAGHGSTYDVIRAYEAWMATNVEYDLRAPLPDPGEDAVHDFLFDTRLGFCEQIASSLTIMLRTQGVPARLVTGYLPGGRDRVAGVFEVRASDAHAWVEVWFPETGWQAFDPTASVPLSADAEIESVGADVIAGLAGYVGDHPTQLATVAVLGIGGAATVRLLAELRHRRRRGRWGLLQDRFGRHAVVRGAAAGASNPALAEAWSRTDDEAVARLVAERLDRIAFDPEFVADDGVYRDTRRLVGSLSSSRPGRRAAS